VASVFICFASTSSDHRLSSPILVPFRPSTCRLSAFYHVYSSRFPPTLSPRALLRLHSVPIHPLSGIFSPRLPPSTSTLCRLCCLCCWLAVCDKPLTTIFSRC
jgi:hypothetical protein